MEQKPQSLKDPNSALPYWVDFDDQKYGGYSLADFEELVNRSHFLRLVEQPWLLECDGQWYVEPGKPLRCQFGVI